MRTNLSNLLLACASLCIAGPGLNAQGFKYVADVPFGFHAANADLKAGKYIFERQMNASVEWMRSVNGAPQLAVSAGPQSLAKAGPARLVFRRRGNDFYLAEIWNSEGKGTIVPRSKAEKALHQSIAFDKHGEVTLYLASMR